MDPKPEEAKVSGHFEDANLKEDRQIQHAEAVAATNREHELTFRDALRLYPKAIMFSLIFSTAIIMEGYDLALIGSFYGYQSYVHRSLAPTTIC